MGNAYQFCKCAMSIRGVMLHMRVLTSDNLLHCPQNEDVGTIPDNVITKPFIVVLLANSVTELAM